MDKEYLKKCNNKIKKLKKTNELESNNSVFYVKDFLLKTLLLFLNFSIFFYWNSFVDIEHMIKTIEISDMSFGSFILSETHFIHSISLYLAFFPFCYLFDFPNVWKEEDYDSSNLFIYLILFIFIVFIFIFLLTFTYLAMTIIFALVSVCFSNFFSFTEFFMAKNIILLFTLTPFLTSIYFFIKSGLKVIENRSTNAKNNSKPKNDDVIKDIFSKISCNLKNIDDFIYFEYVVNEYKLKHLIPVLELCKKNLLIKYKAKNIKELKERHFKDNHIKNENKVFHKTINNN